MRSDLYDRKWSKFLRRVKLFRFVPFVDFVMAAGSLATGKLREESDFDVIVGARKGRIFTVRFFAAAVFQVLGYRRKAIDHSNEAKDKICLNHFVAVDGYRLDPPYDGTLEELYRSLVPIMGDEEKIKEFFKSNDWLEPPRQYKRDERYMGEGRSWVKNVLKALLGGAFGDWLEQRLKNMQMRRIERGLESAMAHKGEIKYSDEELRFHPDRSKWVS